MRSRKGVEDRIAVDPEETRKHNRGSSNVKKVKLYAVLLVTFIGLLTIFWVYSTSFYNSTTTKLTQNYHIQQQQQQHINNQQPPTPTHNSPTNFDLNKDGTGTTTEVVAEEAEKEQEHEPLLPQTAKTETENEDNENENDNNNNNEIEENENENENNDNNEIEETENAIEAEEPGKKEEIEEAIEETLPDEEIYISKIIKAGKKAEKEGNNCVHKPKRNYTQYPVNVFGHSASNDILTACDIPCVYNRADFNYADASLSGPSGCGHTSRIAFSMESVVNYPNLKYESLHNTGYDIVATYELDSDVPLPYFSWAEYNFRKEPIAKTAPSMVAMFVSNCGASNNRLDYVKELMANGITVDSFGKCMHNADAKISSNNYNDVKGETIAKYKFTIAMENSNTKDYVTEKLYTPLSWGTVPIHMGLANIHDYAPDHSVISVHDFESPKELAEYLKELDRNDTKYAEYLAWKNKPFSKKFKALVDISNVHSACRMCIKAADINRIKYGPELRPKNLPTFTKKMLKENSDFLPVWIRERGKYWPMPAFVDGRTVDALKKAALAALRPDDVNGDATVWAIYDRFARVTKDAYITDDDVVKEMVAFTELEAIIVD